jgi:hypothetical protein
MSGNVLPDGSAVDAARFARVAGETPAPVDGTFSLALPRGWRREPVPPVTATPEPGPPVLLALYTGPRVAAFAPFAQVLVARLERDMSAMHWLRFYLAQMQYTPREIETISDNAADALAGLSIDGRVAAARVMVRLYGSYCYIVTVAVPAEAYDDFKDVLGLAVRGFILGGLSPHGHVEHWRDVAADGAPRFSFPQSWSVEAIPAPDGARGEYALLNADASGAMFGQIRVRWLDASFGGSDASEAAKMLEAFELAGVKPGALISTSTERKAQGPYSIVADAIRAATLAGDPRPFEMWQVALAGARHRILMAMLTPAQPQSFYWWAVNRRALEIVISTLR